MMYNYLSMHSNYKRQKPSANKQSLLVVYENVETNSVSQKLIKPN